MSTRRERLVRVGAGARCGDYRDLRAGEEVVLEGVVYAARDQAHRRLVEIIRRGGELPFDLAGAVLYYTGPTPAPPGRVIGSCGPTTSARMDVFTPLLYRHGLGATIGKGPRGSRALAAIRARASVYFHAYGGCGALYAERVVAARPVAFDDLGPEAIVELEIRDFPVIVAVDSMGRSVFSDTRRPASTPGEPDRCDGGRDPGGSR